MKSEKNEIIIYQTENGQTKIDVRLEDKTLRLTQAQMVELFQTTKQNISLHINNAFKEGEIDPVATVKEYLTVQNEGERTVSRSVRHYNLDAILAVGYRVKSLRGTQFRQQATAILHEYLQKGFAMNDDFLKNMDGGLYWKKLLERIRDIRDSEKVMYRRILDLYATSLDYKTTMPETCEFFKIMQNKLHHSRRAHASSARRQAPQPFFQHYQRTQRSPQKNGGTWL
jgi:hypothetical protein